MAGKKHKDVEYSVTTDATKEQIFKTWDEAAAFALGMAVARGEANLDVLIYSTFGAKFYGGSDAVAQYKEDPEASVFERFEIRVNAVGRVP